MQVQSLKELIQAIKTHPHPVVKADDPLNRLLGYECPITKSRWEIGLTHLKRSLDENKTLHEFFNSDAGRQRFLDFLNEKTL